MVVNIREQKGKEIALKSDLIRVSDNHYHVHSQTSNRDTMLSKLMEFGIATVQIILSERYVANIFMLLSFH